MTLNDEVIINEDGTYTVISQPSFAPTLITIGVLLLSAVIASYLSE